MMKIHCHFLCKNEGRILPYFFKHYDQYVTQYFAYFNTTSKDGTRAFLESKPNVTIIRDNYPKLDERVLILMKNVTWMKYSNPSNCDWVFLLDTDEILYNPDLLGLLKKYDEEGVNFPQVKGYQMFNEEFPTEDKQIWELIKKGIEYHPYNKQVVLKPNIAPNYSYGCHFSSPTGPEIKTSENIDIKLLHYKIFGEAYVQERMDLQKTLSAFNIAVDCGTYSLDPNSRWNPKTELEKIRKEAKEVI